MGSFWDPGANHAFMNRQGNRAPADRDSWPKTLAFFGTYLGTVAGAAG